MHARGSSLYFTTGTPNVTTCADILYNYTENISELRSAPFLLKRVPVYIYVDARYSGTLYATAILTLPLHRVNSANISKSET